MRNELKGQTEASPIRSAEGLTVEVLWLASVPGNVWPALEGSGEVTVSTRQAPACHCRRWNHQNNLAADLSMSASSSSSFLQRFIAHNYRAYGTHTTHLRACHLSHDTDQCGKAHGEDRDPDFFLPASFCGPLVFILSFLSPYKNEGLSLKKCVCQSQRLGWDGGKKRHLQFYTWMQCNNAPQLTSPATA